MTALLSGAFLAAVVGAFVNVWLARRKSREEERARVRTGLAEAYQAYAEYNEFPYAIRRRNADKPGDERVRLSESLRAVQARLSFYEASTHAESPAVGVAYGALVRRAREVAGSAMRTAWSHDPVSSDADMNMGIDVVDLRELKGQEEKYMRAVTQHLDQLAVGTVRRWLGAVHRRAA